MKEVKTDLKDVKTELKLNVDAVKSLTDALSAMMEMMGNEYQANTDGASEFHVAMVELEMTETHMPEMQKSLEDKKVIMTTEYILLTVTCKVVIIFHG